MRRAWISVFIIALVLGGCGKDTPSSQDPNEQYFASPTKVVEGIIHAYETRNDSLYASFLSDDFRYYFEPQGADSMDVLGWGKEEEVVGTASLFNTPDVESLDYQLKLGSEKPVDEAGKEGWKMIPVEGGRMVISVKDKDPVEVVLNRQEIVFRPDILKKWRVVEWHDYPDPGSEAPGGE